MRIFYTERFIKSYESAPEKVRRAFEKQAHYLIQNFRHPSLHTKKYDAIRWQARVDGKWRFYFRIEGDVYFLLDIIKHPK